MNQGAIPDESPRNLPEQLLLQDAKAGNCIVIHCGTDRLLGDAPRLVALYGGNSQYWDKMTSIEAFEVNDILYKSIGFGTVRLFKRWSSSSNDNILKQPLKIYR
ncbi:MAG: hypothetical protein WCD53_31255 [Microcoleus sp.]